jgi:hypothetical protein
MNDLTARPVESYEHDTWDEFVASSPQGTLFHTSAWKKVIDNAYAPARLLLLGCFDSRSLLGGCVVLDRMRLGHRTAVTPLVTPYVGFLLDSPPGEKVSDQISLQNSVLGTLTSWLSQNFHYENLINPPHLEDARPLQQAGYRLTPKFTYFVNLRLSEHELWQQLDGSVRRQIKKTEREQFVISDRFEAEVGYQLFGGTFQRHGAKCPVPRSIFDIITGSDHLRDSRQFYCAHVGDRLVSFIVILQYQRTLYYALASTDPEFLSTGVNSYLVCEVIKNNACAEWSTLDFVGANIPSVARFKEGFNPQLKMYFQAERFRRPYMKIGKTFVDMLK